MNKTINKSFITFLSLLFSLVLSAQNSDSAKALLDKVATTMNSYENMEIAFESSLSNASAGIKEGDEAPLKGTILLAGEKYKLDYLGSTFLFDGKKLYVINRDEKEINTSDADLDSNDGFIYPSKLLTFYKEGYNFELGKKQQINGKEIQFIELTPIDSNSEIVKVELGIETSTNHIYKLVQLGANSAKTSFTITAFKSNLELAPTTFTFDKENYLKKNYSID